MNIECKIPTIDGSVQIAESSTVIPHPMIDQKIRASIKIEQKQLSNHLSRLNKSNGTQPDLSKKQFVKNIAVNLLGFGLGIVSGLILTPYWLKSLGESAYGLVALTRDLVMYSSLITVIVSSSVSRFVTIEVGRGNYDRANRTLNTSFWTSVTLGLLVLLVAWAASFYTTSLIDVPPEYERDSRYMLMLAAMSFGVALVATSFKVAMFSTNRIDLDSWTSIWVRIVQIVIGVGLVATVYARPAALLIASLAGSMVGLVGGVYYWRRLAPWSHINRTIDLGVLREQLIFSSWSVVNRVGALLYLHMDLLIINRFLGPVAGGQYAALLQWPLLLRSFGAIVFAVFAPSIMHHYARNAIDDMVKYIRWGTRMMGLILSLPIGLICGLGQPLLTIWLGPKYSNYNWLLLLMVLHLSINVSISPLFSALNAANRVKVPALVTCVLGAGNLFLAIFLTTIIDIYGVAAASAIMLTAKNTFFLPIYTAKTLGCRWHVFFLELVEISLLTCAVTAFGLLGSHFLSLNTLPRLATACLMLGLMYVTVVWFVVLSRKERNQLWRQFIEPILARMFVLTNK